MNLYSARQVGGIFLALAGFLMIASGVLLNPWVAAWVMGPSALDRRDVLLAFLPWGMVLGAVNLVLGLRLAANRPGWEGPALCFFLASTVVLTDRLLLVFFGLPLWVYDPVLLYRNRPDKVLRWERSNASSVAHINRYGHHDDDFPKIKPAGEFRALILGDSITMGHGVTREQTFSNQLETLLGGSDTRHTSHQVINTGVHGYSTFQELQVLKESLVFEPDFIALGFCMNDVTEPFVKDRGLGGVGLDYHGVLQTPSVILGFLFNETGFGRLLQKTRAREKSREAEKLKEVYSVSRLARASEQDTAFEGAWRLVLRDLESIYETVRVEEIPFVLMIFPFDFQLLESDAHEPQRILLDHAKLHGVSAIDFTGVFGDLVYSDDLVLRTLGERGYGTDEIAAFFAWRMRKYFIDADHLTPEGHTVVAERLLTHLVERGLVCSRDQREGCERRHDAGTAREFRGTAVAEMP